MPLPSHGYNLAIQQGLTKDKGSEDQKAGSAKATGKWCQSRSMGKKQAQSYALRSPSPIPNCRCPPQCHGCKDNMQDTCTTTTLLPRNYKLQDFVPKCLDIFKHFKHKFVLLTPTL